MNVNFFIVGVVFSTISSSHCEDSSTTIPGMSPTEAPLKKPIPLQPIETTEEDLRVLNQSIAKYGQPPQDYKKLNLPGPLILVDKYRDVPLNMLSPGPVSGTYTLRTRSVSDYFSYNARHEETSIKIVNDTQIPISKGQFGEHFERESGGYYIRSIGYTLDENGYNEFLIDITRAVTNLTEVSEVTEPPKIFGGEIFSGEPVGGPVKKITISSTVLATLTGGNSLG